MSSGKPVNIKIGKTENTMDIDICVFEDEVPVNWGTYDSSNSYCGSKVPIKVMGRIDYEEQEMSIRWDEVGNSEAIKLFTDIHADVYNDRKFFMRYEVGEFTLLIQEFLLLGYGDSFKDEDVDKTVLAIIPIGEPIEGDTRGYPTSWEWKTTTTDEVMEIPVYGGYNYGIQISWGDGTIENYAGDGSVKPSHIYSVAGKYIVEVLGQCKRLVFHTTPEADKVTRILDLGETGLINCVYMYYGTNPDSVEFLHSDTSSVTNMNYMMTNWSNITTPPDMSLWDVSKVSIMDYMFLGWTGCTIDDTAGIHLWNISSLTRALHFASNGSTIATATMDKILANWSIQPHKSNVTINFRDGYYTDTASYDALVASGWDISGISIAP